MNQNEAKILPFARPETDEGTPDDVCWLKRLGVGSVFTCQRKGNGADYEVHPWAVASISEVKQTYGLQNLQTNKPELVNPIRFCNVFELVEVLRNREEYLAEKALNDKRNWPDKSARLADDEGLQGVDQTDEVTSPRGL